MFEASSETGSHHLGDSAHDLPTKPEVGLGNVAVARSTVASVHAEGPAAVPDQRSRDGHQLDVAPSAFSADDASSSVSFARVGDLELGSTLLHGNLQGPAQGHLQQDSWTPNLDTSAHQQDYIAESMVQAATEECGWQQNSGVLQSRCASPSPTQAANVESSLITASARGCARAGQEALYSTLATNTCGAGQPQAHTDGSGKASFTRHQVAGNQQGSICSTGDVPGSSETVSARQPEGQANVVAAHRSGMRQSTVFFPGVFPDEMEVCCVSSLDLSETAHAHENIYLAR